MSEVSLIAKATVVLLAALLAARLARGSAASMRALILTAAFGALLAIPLAEVVVPSQAVEVRLPRMTPRAGVVFAPGIEAPPTSAGNAVSEAASTPAPSRIPQIGAFLQAVWRIGVLIVFLRLGAALWRLRALKRSSQRWLNATAESILRERTSRRIDLFLHRDLAAPMTCGIVRPAIGLPMDARSWPEAELRQALIHEAEHIRRGDWLVQLLAKVACALYWFHPLAWTAARRLFLECEHACDDAVVRVGERTAYAQQLVSMARRLSGRISGHALSMADRRDLAERVDAVLNSARPRGEVSVMAAVTTAMVALLVTAAIAPWRAVAAQSRAAVEDILPIPTALAGKGFEAVRIRIGDRQGSSSASFDPETGRFIARNASLLWLVSQAYASVPSLSFVPEEPYELHDTRITGGPDWMHSDTFDIDARAGLPVSAEDLRAMLRQLLHDAFDLFVRIEKQETPAYRLVRADAGGSAPGLRPGDTNCADKYIDTEGGPGRIERRCTTLAAFAAGFTLAEVLGRPVVDRTGLTGVFDVSLSYAPTRDELSTIYELRPEQLPRELSERPSIFQAFEQQLGLKLESTRAAIYTLAVDHAERPTASR